MFSAAKKKHNFYCKLTIIERGFCILYSFAEASLIITAIAHINY